MGVMGGPRCACYMLKGMSVYGHVCAVLPAVSADKEQVSVECGRPCSQMAVDLRPCGPCKGASMNLC